MKRTFLDDLARDQKHLFIQYVQYDPINFSKREQIANFVSLDHLIFLSTDNGIIA